MRALFFLGLILFVLGGMILVRDKVETPISEPSANMKISSPAFSDKDRIPKKYTCDDVNVNPPLDIEGVPEGAESLALIMDDPDAPVGTWVHWTLWNIPPDTYEIKENSVPEGANEGNTSFGHPGYGGPCPPFGTHRYFFKLYALDTKLDLSSSADKDKLERAMTGHILAEARFYGVYSRR